MTVSITWSITSGGSAATSLAAGSSANGDNTQEVEVFIRHNGSNPITDCYLYFTQKSGTYTGEASAPEDFNELISWGDASTSDTFGGIQVNMDAINDYTGGSTWGMSSSQKTSADNLKFTVRTAVAGSSSTGVLLSKNTSSSMSSDGVLPAGATASFKLRVKVPVAEDTTGARLFDQVLKFQYTS